MARRKPSSRQPRFASPRLSESQPTRSYGALLPEDRDEHSNLFTPMLAELDGAFFVTIRGHSRGMVKHLGGDIWFWCDHKGNEGRCFSEAGAFDAIGFHLLTKQSGERIVVPKPGAKLDDLPEPQARDKYL